MSLSRKVPNQIIFGGPAVRPSTLRSLATHWFSRFKRWRTTVRSRRTSTAQVCGKLCTRRKGECCMTPPIGKISGHSAGLRYLAANVSCRVHTIKRLCALDDYQLWAFCCSSAAQFDHPPNKNTRLAKFVLREGAKPGRQWGLTAPPAQTGLSISRCIEERLTCSKCPTTRVRDDRMYSGTSYSRSILDRQHEPCESRNTHEAPGEGKGTITNGEIVVDMTRRTVQALAMSRV
jgi:hypothetical protein